MSTIKVTDVNHIPDLIKDLEYIDTHEIHIGVVGDNDEKLVMIASVNEFGCNITVTEKMRRYLAAVSSELGLEGNLKQYGMYKKVGSTVHIPERSYIRSTYDKEQANASDYANRLLKKVILGQISGEQCMKLVGEYLKSKIQKHMREIGDPGNAPFTQFMKADKYGNGIDNPLIGSGRLRQSINYEVVAK